jgi:hypothetical protein
LTCKFWWQTDSSPAVQHCVCSCWLCILLTQLLSQLKKKHIVCIIVSAVDGCILLNNEAKWFRIHINHQIWSSDSNLLMF